MGFIFLFKLNRNPTVIQINESSANTNTERKKKCFIKIVQMNFFKSFRDYEKRQPEGYKLFVGDYLKKNLKSKIVPGNFHVQNIK